MKTALSKAWTWVKHHWYVPFLIILMILFASLQNGIKNKFFDLFELSRKRYKEELDVINKNNDIKDKEKDKIIKGHQEALTKIEEEFDVKIEALEKEKREEISNLVEKHKEKPEEMAKEIARILGAKHVE